MKKLIRLVSVASVLSLLAITVYGGIGKAEARSFRARGANGVAGGFSRAGQYGQAAGVGGALYGKGIAGAGGGRFYGPNGGTVAGAGGAVLGKNAGFGGGAFNASGPNGGTSNGAGAFGYKRGVGGFAGTQMNATGANGSTYNGYTRGQYNAQTGQGTYDASRQGYNAQTNQNYGYTNSTSYQKGEGATSSISTENHGDYSVDWNKGQKPVVTPVATPQ